MSQPHYKGVGQKNDRPLTKVAWKHDGHPNEIYYGLFVNRKMENISKVIIKDKLQEDNPSVTIIPESIKVYQGSWLWRDDKGEWELQNRKDVTSEFASKLQLDGDKRGFTIQLGDIPSTRGYLINYRVKANYNLRDGEELKNYAEIQS